MELNQRPININITSATILKVIAIFALLYLMFLIKDVLILFFVALVFSSALDPSVDWLKQRKIPRTLSVLLIYLTAFAIVALVLYLILPPIIKEVNDISSNLPDYFNSIVSKYNALKNFSEKHRILDQLQGTLGLISGYLQSTASGVVFTLFNIFGGIFSSILVLVLTFYMVVEESAMKKIVWSIAPAKHQPYLMNLINRIQIKLGYWLRGTLILSLTLAAMAYLGLKVLGVNYALILALMVGLLSFIPFMGAILGAIPALFIAFTQSPLLAVSTLIIFLIFHFIEDNYLYPQIMRKAVGLNPVVSIMAMLAGFKLAGVIGAVLSIPVTTAISVVAKDIFGGREGKENLKLKNQS
ncbi:MAG: AI-2E family transporter [bacterium]|nr:AI-2E family transporter [bacterium]